MTCFLSLIHTGKVQYLVYLCMLFMEEYRFVNNLSNHYTIESIYMAPCDYRVNELFRFCSVTVSDCKVGRGCIIFVLTLSLITIMGVFWGDER